MIENVKKLINLVKNYDKIMVLIENKQPEKVEKPKKYSTFNTPLTQLEHIISKKKGE